MVNRKKKKRTVRAEFRTQRSNPRKSLDKQSERSKNCYSQIVFRDWCKKCGICSAFCPKKVIGKNEEGGPIFERPEDCIGCRFCELHCPDFAITIEESDRPSGGNK